MRATVDRFVETDVHISWDRGNWKGSVIDNRTATYDRTNMTRPIIYTAWSDNIQQMAEHMQGELEETHRKYVQDREELERAQREIDNFLAQEPDQC